MGHSHVAMFLAVGLGIVCFIAIVRARLFGRVPHGFLLVLMVAVAGTGLTFGMWWVYFVVPAADLLHAHRERSFRYGYLHYVVIGGMLLEQPAAVMATRLTASRAGAALRPRNSKLAMREAPKRSRHVRPSLVIG